MGMMKMREREEGGVKISVEDHWFFIGTTIVKSTRYNTGSSFHFTAQKRKKKEQELNE